MKIDVEIGLCTKDMAKENPVKDFEILIEEHKDKWSEQMYDYFKECLSIIKKELKRLEELDTGAYVSIHINRYNELCDKEDALQIIIEKQVSVGTLLVLDDLQQYNDYCDMVGGCKKLTQEEYDLLKEVLL